MQKMQPLKTKVMRFDNFYKAYPQPVNTHKVYAGSSLYIPLHFVRSADYIAEKIQSAEVSQLTGAIKKTGSSAGDTILINRTDSPDRFIYLKGELATETGCESHDYFPTYAFLIPDEVTTQLGKCRAEVQLRLTTASGDVFYSEPEYLDIQSSIFASGGSALTTLRPVDVIPTQSHFGSGNFRTFELSSLFENTSNNPVTYTLETTGDLQAVVIGSSVRVTSTGPAGGNVFITANNSISYASTFFIVRSSSAVESNPPQWSPIPVVNVKSGGNRSINLGSYCSDPSNLQLTYTAVCSDPSLVLVSISGSTLNITAASGFIEEIEQAPVAVTISATNSRNLTSDIILGVYVTEASVDSSVKPLILSPSTEHGNQVVSQALGTSVSLTVNVVSGTYTRIAWYKKDGVSWRGINVEGSVLTFALSPETAGVYKAYVTNAEVGKTPTIVRTAETNVMIGSGIVPISGARISAYFEGDRVVYGTTVFLTASYTAGTSPVMIRFTKNGVVVRDWDASNTYTFEYSPETVGTYVASLYNASNGILSPVNVTLMIGVPNNTIVPTSAAITLTRDDVLTGSNYEVGSSPVINLNYYPTNLSSPQAMLVKKDLNDGQFYEAFSSGWSNTQTFVIEDIELGDSGYYAVKVRDAGNVNVVVTSNEVFINVVNAPSGSVAISSVGISTTQTPVELGGVVEVAVNVSPGNALTPITYKLYKDGVLLNTSNNSLYEIDDFHPLVHGGVYRYVAENALGVVSSPLAVVPYNFISPLTTAVLSVVSCVPSLTIANRYTIAVRVSNLSNIELSSTSLEWISPAGVTVNGVGTGFTSISSVAGGGSFDVELSLDANPAQTDKLYFVVRYGNLASEATLNTNIWLTAAFPELVTSLGISHTKTLGGQLIISGIPSPFNIQSAVYTLYKDGVSLLSQAGNPQFSIGSYSPVLHDGTYHIVVSQGTASLQQLSSPNETVAYSGTRTTLALDNPVGYTYDNGILVVVLKNIGTASYTGGVVKASCDDPQVLINGLSGIVNVPIAAFSANEALHTPMTVTRNGFPVEASVTLTVDSGNLNSIFNTVLDLTV